MENPIDSCQCVVAPNLTHQWPSVAASFRSAAPTCEREHQRGSHSHQPPPAQDFDYLLQSSHTAPRAVFWEDWHPQKCKKCLILLVPGERIELPTNGLQKIDRALPGVPSHNIFVGRSVEKCYFHSIFLYKFADVYNLG
jgi:hypothetical protein